MPACIRPWGPSDCVIVCLYSAHDCALAQELQLPLDAGTRSQFAVSGQFCRLGGDRQVAR